MGDDLAARSAESGGELRLREMKALGLGHLQPTAVMSTIRVDQHAVHVEYRGQRLVLGRQRQFHGNMCSLAGRRFDGHATLQQPHALADALQPESMFLDGSRVETDSPVADVDANTVAALAQRHADPVAAAMPNGVGQRLLNDAEDRIFQRRRKTLAGRVLLEFDLRPAGPVLFVHQILNGLDDAELVEHRRTQAADQPTGLVDGAADQLHARVKSFPRLGRIARERLAKGLQAEDCAGKLLGEAVVNLVGDQLAFLLVNVEQSPQQLLLFLDALGGQPLPGHIGANGHDALGAVLFGQPHEAAQPPQAENVLHFHALRRARGKRLIQHSTTEGLILRRDENQAGFSEQRLPSACAFGRGLQTARSSRGRAQGRGRGGFPGGCVACPRTRARPFPSAAAA